ncbi:MAG: 30S ribosomal protein S2 [Actinobacteria bacterium HGW-Actinobacteria-8]|nr:MAG: 30S ribosomal protein S2 [Actinobacteria bacterium HGW-Actinobacteria-8]
MAVVTMREMLDAGVHFGHQTSRWNPKMKRFILTERNGNYIIDLQQSLAMIDAAYEFVRETVAHGGTVLFVGTKRQAQSTISEQAARVGMPYVNERWLGGMLTNFQTVSKRVARLKELEELDFDDVAGSGRTKKELLILRREKDKLLKVLNGIRDMGKTPSVVWIVDTNKEHLAVDEAKKLGIPIVGILDSNCDPDSVQYGIPGNDDAIRSVGLLTRVISDAIAEGIKQRYAAKAGDEAEPTAEIEPLAAWEQELLDGSEKPAADAKDDAAPAAEATEEALAADAKDDAAQAEEATEEAPAAEEKPAKKPAAKKPAAKKAADEAPVESKPAAKKPAAKPAEKKTTSTAAADDAAPADTK